MKFTLLFFVVFAVCATIVAAQEPEPEDIELTVCPEDPAPEVPELVECFEGGDNEPMIEPMIEPTLAVCPEYHPDFEIDERIVPVIDLLDD